MHSPEHNLTLVQIMIGEIEDYLLSDELFWPCTPSALNDGPKSLRLTPGTLALALDELEGLADEMTAAQRAKRYKLNLQMQRVLMKWAAPLGKKAAREMHSRLNLWKAYIDDLAEKIDRTDNYTYEVRQRVIFERISAWAKREAETKTTIQAIQPIDIQLRSFFMPGEFIWDQRLRASYPEAQFWFLYGLPVLNDAD